METTEKTMTPEESLEIIRKTILHSRKNLREGSFYYLLWGWIVIFGCLSNYVLIWYAHRKELYEALYIRSMISWGIFVFAGVCIQLIHFYRSARKEMVQTHIDRFLLILWSATGAVMIFMVFFCYKQSNYPTSYLLIIAALATFVSGMAVKYRPLVAGGIIFALASVPCIYLDGQEQLLVFAGAMVLGYMVPGYMLRKVKQEDHV
jgi:membrane-associated HD superfamily phosphohydrolase